MRVALYSDLHLEFENHRSALRLADNADVRILAGDIGTRGGWFDWVLAQGDIPTIIVPGNHEYYHEAFPAHLQALKAAFDQTHVQVLDNDAVTLSGVRFLGTTLWSDYRLYGEQSRDHAMNMAHQQLTDFRVIRWSEADRPLTPSDAAGLFKKAVEWLEQELVSSASKTRVVVTHHAPSIRSIEPGYAGSPLNGAFASDLEAFIMRHQPALWVHGHLHHSLDYQIGTTRIVCNPRGYACVETNPQFQNPFVVELEG